MAFLSARIVAFTEAVSPGSIFSTVFGSNSTSQFTGVEALSEISVSGEEPVFFTTSSTFSSSPAVISVLRRPVGVVSSILYDPVITTSKSSLAEVELVVAITGIVYVPALIWSGGLISTVIFEVAFGAIFSEVDCV